MWISKLFICFILAQFQSEIIRATNTVSHSRHKRAFWNFRDVIQCVTGRSAFYDFNGYGCWCGAGGNGEPVDDVDRCCHNHDLCYEQVIDRWLCFGFNPIFYSLSPYTGHYAAECVNGDIQCLNTYGSCAYASCLCDREMGHCLRRYEYDEQYSPAHMDRESTCGTTEHQQESEAMCLQYGDVRPIKVRSGAPSEIASYYDLRITGIEGSNRMADDDAPTLNLYKHCFRDVALRLGIQPSLIAAIASRVSKAGRLLNSDGFNTVSSNLYGILGCDVDRWTDCLTHRALPEGTDCSHVNYTITQQLRNPFLDIHRGNSALSSETKLRDGLRQYLGSSNPVWQKNFDNDVIARAQRLYSFHQWNCIERNRGIYEETPIQVAPEDNCKLLAEQGSCNFFQRCMERKVPCYGKGYAIRRGENFCLRYREHYNDFNADGQTWIDEFWSCTMSQINNNLKRPLIKCGTLNDLAKEAEFKCMKKHGFCGIIEGNIEAVKEVYDAGLYHLSIWYPFEHVVPGVDLFTAPPHETEIWRQVYRNYVSCMYGCDMAQRGFNCPNIFKNLWIWLRSDELWSDIGKRKRRSVDECGALASNGDCDFWKCLDNELQCASQIGGNIAKEFHSPFCFKVNLMANVEAKNILKDTERCLMNRILDRISEDSNICESLDLQFEIVANVTECLVESGICRISVGAEWALERITNVKSFPAVLPDDYGKISSTGNMVRLSAEYYEWLKFFKQQIGDAKRVCYYRGVGDVISPNLYETRYNPDMGTEVKYRILDDRSEL